MQTIDLKAILELIKASSDGIDYNRPEPNSTMNAFVGKMKREGLEEIGAGTMALVFHKPGTKEVVKAFRRDNCYVKFLTLISNNKDNIHFPRIIQYEQLKTPPYAGLHIVKMEKLNKLDTAREKGIADQASLFIGKPSKENKQGLDTLLDRSVALKGDKQNKTFSEAVDMLANTPLGSCHIDLHSANIMKRDDGTLVVIDPFI